MYNDRNVEELRMSLFEPNTENQRDKESFRSSRSDMSTELRPAIQSINAARKIDYQKEIVTKLHFILIWV